MKIEINWDLIRKINQAKYGFDLQRDFKIDFFVSTIVTLAFSLPTLNDPDYQKKLLIQFGINYVYGLVGICIGECVSNKVSKANAKHILKIISYLLNDINIETNADLLMKSENYLTKYKVKLNDYKIPYLLQEKYINVPISNNKNDKNNSISILQEHVIGSNKYIITRGKPEKKKVLKLAFNQI